MVRKMFSSWGTDGEPVFSKGDHEKAYRQWPVSPEDYALLVTLVWSDMVGHSGGFEAYAHRALPFGALAAVIIYTCISQGVCHILRRIFAVPQLAYVDDFLRCSIRKWASSQEIAFRGVHGFIGIPLKVGKEDVSQCIEVLGHIISAQALWAGLRMTDKRRESVILRVSTALLKGFGDKEMEVHRPPQVRSHGYCGENFVLLRAHTLRRRTRAHWQAEAAGLSSSTVVGGSAAEPTPKGGNGQPW